MKLLLLSKCVLCIFSCGCGMIVHMVFSVFVRWAVFAALSPLPSDNGGQWRARAYKGPDANVKGKGVGCKGEGSGLHRGREVELLWRGC